MFDRNYDLFYHLFSKKTAVKKKNGNRKSLMASSGNEEVRAVAPLVAHPQQSCECIALSGWERRSSFQVTSLFQVLAPVLRSWLGKHLKMKEFKTT